MQYNALKTDKDTSLSDSTIPWKDWAPTSKLNLNS